MDVPAKTFRTSGAPLLAAVGFAALPPPGTARQRQAPIKGVVEVVARELRNTPAVARASYIHPLVFDAYESGSLQRVWRAGPPPARRGGLAPGRPGPPPPPPPPPPPDSTRPPRHRRPTPQ